MANYQRNMFFKEVHRPSRPMMMWSRSSMSRSVAAAT